MCNSCRDIRKKMEDTGVDLDRVNEVVEEIGLEKAKIISEYASAITMNELNEKFMLMVGGMLRAWGVTEVEISGADVRELNRQIEAGNIEIEEDAQLSTFTFRIKTIADNPVHEDDGGFAALIAALEASFPEDDPFKN